MSVVYLASTLQAHFERGGDFRLVQSGPRKMSLAETGEAMLQGEPIDLDSVPDLLKFTGNSLPQPLPKLFVKQGMLVVNPEIAEVISQFDLGEGHLWPLSYEGPGECSFFGVYVGSIKSAWLEEESTAKRSGLRHQRIDYLALKYGKGTVVLDKTALEGADLWVDSKQASGLVFFSEALAKALTDLSVLDEILLLKCEVVEHE